MAKTRKPTLMDRLMAEKINFGGTLMTRAQVVTRMQEDGQPQACIDRFAFAGEPLSEAAQESFRATCQCGCRMLSGFVIQIEECGSCGLRG